MCVCVYEYMADSKKTSEQAIENQHYQTSSL